MPGWVGYEASDMGRIRSLDRMVPGRWKPYWKPGRILAQSCYTTPYPHVSLYRNGKPTSLSVHALVLWAFAGAPLPGQIARHGPMGVTVNWWPENLCWGSHQDNVVADRLRDGTFLRGEQIYGAKLTAVIVAECRRRRQAGESVMALATEFGVNRSTMHEAVTGVRWKHVA